MEVEVNLKDVKVMIGVPIVGGGKYHPKVLNSLVAAIQAGTLVGMRIDFMQRIGSLYMNRNLLLDSFVKSDLDYLFMIDSDMVFEPMQFFRVLALTKLYDIVGCTYPNKHEGNADVNKIAGEVPNVHGLMKVKGMGLGFTCISRKVAETLSASKPIYDTVREGKVPWVFNAAALADGRVTTEDMAFFVDCRAAGFDVWLDGTQRLGHMFEKELRFPAPRDVGQSGEQSGEQAHGKAA